MLTVWTQLTKLILYGGIVELVNTSALQAEDFGFEPRYRHHDGSVVELVNTLASQAKDCEFDPRQNHQESNIPMSAYKYKRLDLCKQNKSVLYLPL